MEMPKCYFLIKCFIDLIKIITKFDNNNIYYILDLNTKEPLTTREQFKKVLQRQFLNNAINLLLNVAVAESVG